MARMIPSIIDSTCSSPGEREIFQRLRDDPATEGWTVLHSLDVAEHRKQISGEIDFVAIIPSKGVLCIEVKACSKLEREEETGLWFYGSDRKGDPRGPFKQVSDSMHSIREYVVKQRPDLSRVVFWSAVVFPYVPFSDASNEWHSWQVIGSLGLRWRSRLMLRLARELNARGPVPSEESLLIELPGVGPYAAAAFLSLHANRRASIIDSNVVRWLCRVTGRNMDGETRRKKWIKQLADELTPRTNFREYNYAVLDFTMRICGRAPRCDVCPLAKSHCAYSVS